MFLPIETFSPLHVPQWSTFAQKIFIEFAFSSVRVHRPSRTSGLNLELKIRRNIVLVYISLDTFVSVLTKNTVLLGKEWDSNCHNTENDWNGNNT
jgi:hypothetical protein